MADSNLFSAGTAAGLVPEGDAARQAVASLRGYAYQALASALAWMDLGDRDALYLEVAEDYAVVAQSVLNAAQVKDTQASGTVTLANENAKEAIAGFVDLVERNPDRAVYLRFLTTAPVGTERAVADRPAGSAGLEYWRKVSGGMEEVGPLRAVLMSETYKQYDKVQAFVTARDDAALREELVRRIRWDCGQPPFAVLQEEVEERLVVLCRDKFAIPSQEVPRLVDVLVYHVIKKSVLPETRQRVLTLAELYSVIDTHTRVSLPRAQVDVLSQLGPALGAALGLTGLQSLLTASTNWLISTSSLPVVRGLIDRPVVLGGVKGKLKRHGVALLFGSTGLGKSDQIRRIGIAQSSDSAIVDCRNLEAEQVIERLDTVFGLIGGLSASVLVLEDINCLDEARVMMRLARVWQALRRRDRQLLITCFRAPSATSLAAAGLDPDCTFECPYFSEEEVNALVRAHRGDAAKWGKLAFLVGAGGHPQLTHAFVLGMADRGWPDEDLAKVVTRGLSNDELDATREAARRTLSAALGEEARNLLYRLSLTNVRLRRALVMAIAEVPVAIRLPGEHFDKLVGPWIEAFGNDTFRVSPLASGFGREMLAADEQSAIHAKITTHVLERRQIDAGDADAILLHALSGGSVRGLMMLAYGVMTAASDTVEKLAKRLTVFRLLRTDQLIFPTNPAVSGLLRIAQFKLASAVMDEGTAAIAGALTRETDEMTVPAARAAFKFMADLIILITPGIASLLDDWVSRLHAFKILLEDDSLPREFKTGLEETSGGAGIMYGMLFGIGFSGLTSSSKLESIIDHLAALDAGERMLWLAPVDTSFADYSILINSPWGVEQRRDDFDAAAAEARYRRIAEKTRDWGLPKLTAQSWAARAAMHDEYLNDSAKALQIIDEAQHACGPGVILERARAKVHWRSGNHANAVRIMREIADLVGQDNPVERAFALRQAAISAAKTEDWRQAEEWFLEAQKSAAKSELDSMMVMAVGLGADAAVAALHRGAVERALDGIWAALDSLGSIDPASSTRAGYCHRVIRHTALWVQTTIEQRDTKIDGQPVAMESGACSNPEPPDEVLALALGPLDLAYYMLAEAELFATGSSRLASRIPGCLLGGPIAVVEVSLKQRIIEVAIDKLDVEALTANLPAFFDAMSFLAKESARLKADHDILNPDRHAIPALSEEELLDPKHVPMIMDVFLAFALRAVMLGALRAISQLETAIESDGKLKGPAATFLNLWRTGDASTGQHFLEPCRLCKIVMTGVHATPREFWYVGLRFFGYAENSNFRRLLMRRLADWQREGWHRILTTESFRLRQPMRTRPAVEAALASPLKDRAFVADILLAAMDAVGSSLDDQFMARLKQAIQAG